MLSPVRAQPAAVDPAVPAASVASAASAPSVADGAPAEIVPMAPVTVVGIKDPASARYLTLQAGVAAFEKFHKLAPQSSLRFQARPAPGAPPLDGRGLLLKLEGADLALPLALDEDLSFNLPEPALAGAAGKDSEVLANRRAGHLRILAWVRTPGLPSDQRRLGDLRLQCEVNWAIEKQNMSVLVRGALSLTGGFCRSSYIGIAFGQQGRKIEEAVLTQGDQRLVLPLSNQGLSYLPPLWDKTWSDDAKISFRLAGSAG